MMFSYYFPPMGGVEVQRVTKFVKHLPEFGWEPIVVTSRWGYHTAYDKTLLDSLPKSLKIVRIPSIEHPGYLNREKILKKGREEWKEFNSSKKLSIRILRFLYKYDINHLCFPDEKNGWAGLVNLVSPHLIARYKPDVLWATGFPWSTLNMLSNVYKSSHIPAVGDIRDPWTWHPRKFWETEKHRDLERFVFTHLPYIVTVTDGLKRVYEAIYPNLSNRFTVICNGYKENDVLRPKDKYLPINFNYIGSLTRHNPKDIKGQSFFTFLQAMATLRLEGIEGFERIRVSVAGNGVDGSQCLLDEFQLNEQVKIFGNLPYARAREMRDESDILILVMGNAPKAETFATFKLYEYLAANRPILALLPKGSEAGKIIIEKHRGVVCQIDDVNSICEGIRRLLTGNYEYDPNSDISEYSSINTTRQLSQLLETAINAR